MLTNQATGPDVFREAVLRTFSGLRVCCPGKRSATGEMAARLAAKHKNKRPSLSTEPFALFDAWQFPTLTWGDPTLPS
ncbi:hypothetical protein PGO02_19675, partial [Klebsiella aerogenes]